MKTFPRSICLFLLLYFLPFIPYAQSNIDDSIKVVSLKKALLSQKEDTNKINTLNELSGLLDHDRASALEYAKQALSLSQKINFRRGEGNAYYQLGIAEAGSNYVGEMGNMNKVLEYFNKAIEIFKESGNQFDIADAYNRIAYAYANLNSNSPETEKYFYAALKIYEKLGAKERLASIYRELGLEYINTGNYDKGFETLKASLTTFEEMKDSASIANTCIYAGLGYYQAMKLDDALYYFNKALTTYKTLGNRSPDFGIPWAKGNIADVYILQGENAFSAGNKQLAREKIQDALLLCKERLILEDEGNMSHRQTYLQLGNCYNDLSYMLPAAQKNVNLLESKKYYELSLDLGKKINNKNLLSNSYYKLSQAHSSLGNYKEAYENYTSFITYRDSIYNEESTKKTVKEQMQYEFDKKEAVIKTEQDKKDAETKRIKNQHYFLIAGLLVIVLAVFIIVAIQYRNNKHKQKANLLLERQKKKVESTLAELKSTQSQLIQSEKMASLGELTAGIAHEIQNPLNFVNNFSEVNNELIDELKSRKSQLKNEEQNELLNDIFQNNEKIIHHGKRADAIVKGMLQHSQSGKGQKEATDINRLSDEYLKLSYHGIRAKDPSLNATLSTQFDPTIGTVNIIPQDIGRVLLNLYNNAFYAVNEKQKHDIEGYNPLITVSTKKNSDNIEITVTDNGTGISQKVIDKIFQPFFTTKPTGQGTGLGLSLSYDITKAHGGEITVETKEDDGTTFTIHLPVA